MNRLSVISSSSCAGSTPSSSAIAPQASAAKRGARNWTGDRLTAIGRSGQRRAIWQASRKAMLAELVDHAAFLGDRDHLGTAATWPRVGWSQRSRPSSPATLPRPPMIGWKWRSSAATVAKLGAQADLDLVAALDVGVHRLGEDAEAVAAGRLGAVHGDVGLAQQLGGLGDLLGGEHRADADSDPRLAVADDEGLADDVDDPLAQAADVGLALGADLDDGEFVAADAGDGVGLAQQRAQPLADFLDELVAGIVAERVVDLLEAVEIEHQQGDLLARAAIAGQRLGEAVLEQGAVGEAGQLVVERLMLGIGLARLELLDEVDERFVEEGHDEDRRRPPR